MGCDRLIALFICFSAISCEYPPHPHQLITYKTS